MSNMRQGSFSIAPDSNLLSSGDMLDVLWRDEDGVAGLHTIKNNTLSTSSMLGQIGLEWQVVATGDFNNDGSSDILMRRDDGTLGVFDVANHQVQDWRMLGQVGLEWQVVGTGQF